MALFDENVTVTPSRRRGMSRRALVGVWSLSIAMVVLFVLTVLPTSYVIQRPGPVYNTLGTAESSDGEQVPLIEVDGATTYPTDGALDLLTVQVVGNRERTPSWLELATAWFDPSRAVLPIDAVFPEGQSTQERSQESSALMVDSQKEATAAALTELGYDVSPHLTVNSLTEGSAAEGILEEGDVIVSADGVTVADVDALREIVNAGDGAPIEVAIERGGVARDGQRDPRADRGGRRDGLAHGRHPAERLRLPDRCDHPAEQCGRSQRRDDVRARDHRHPHARQSQRR